MHKKRISVGASALLGIAIFVLGIFTPFIANATPVLADPGRYKVELFSDFSSFGRLKAWQLSISGGQNGFGPGMYVTSGPLPDDRSDRLLAINSAGQASVVKSGLVSNESLVFAKGAYGQGMLVTEPQQQRILRILADGTTTVFAANFTAPFGPAVLTYGPDPLNPSQEVLYATDFSSGNVLILAPDGSVSPFSFLAAQDKILALDAFGRYGGRFVAGIFNFASNPDTGKIYSVSADGATVNLLADALNGIQLMSFGPGGEFGSKLFVASEGRDFPTQQVGDGAVFTLETDGTLTPFLTGIDAASIAFDTEGVLGGGMFVADIVDDPNAPSRIWRITAIPEPETLPLVSLALVIGMGMSRNRKRS